jgi:putative membrane protein
VTAARTRAAAVSLRRLHPVSLLFNWFALARQLVFPLVLTLLQLRSGSGAWWRYVLAGAVLLLIVGSVVRYLNTRFGLTRDALHVRSGVLSRQSRVIPFGRIQSVQVKQSALQRVLGMGELRVETATTGASAEVALKVLRWADAQALREQLVRERRSALAAAVSARGAAAGTPPADASDAASLGHDTIAPHAAPEGDEQATVIAALDAEQLMLAGGTSNNIGVLVVVLFSGCERIRSSFFDDLDVAGGIANSAFAVSSAVGGATAAALFLLIVVIPLLVASWMVSVGGALVRYYGFTLERAGRDLRRRHGLFSRTEASVPVQRAQALHFHQSMLRRPFDLGELHLVSAGASRGGEGTSGGRQVLLPILRRASLAAFVPEVFPSARLEEALTSPMSRGAWHRPRPMAAVRMALVFTVQWGVVLGLVWWWRPEWAFRMGWLLPVLWALAVVRQRARGLVLVHGHVIVREGGIARTIMILPESKLQLVEVRQGPLQRVFGLATVRLTTAGNGGDADMVDLSLADARSVQKDLVARLPSVVRRSPGTTTTAARPPFGSLVPESVLHGR